MKTQINDLENKINDLVVRMNNAEETLTNNNKYDCEHCEKKTDAKKIMNILEPPDVLVVHLKRFEFTKYGTCTKIYTKIDFPLENLTIDDNFSDIYKKDGNIYENLLFLEKKDGLISILHDPKNADRSFAFVTTKEKLRKVYRQFEKAKALRRDYIFIIKDGDEIKIKGVDSEV